MAEAALLAETLHEQDLPPLLATAVDGLDGHDSLTDLLDQALIAEPPLLARDGGFIAPGYHAELDEARQCATKGAV